MAIQMSADDVAAAAARKTVPVPDKQPATLQVEPQGAPAAPEPAIPSPDAELQKKVQALEKQNAELLKGDKAKDKAIEDLKRVQETPQVPATPGKSDDEPDALDDLKHSVTKEILDALSSRLDQKLADHESRLKPLLEEGQAAHKQREEQAAIAVVGEEAFNEHKSAAYETQEKHPTLSLTEAFTLLVAPKELQTAPKTEVEGARGPAPQPGRTPGDVYADHLATARKLQAAGQHSKADAAFTEAVDDGVPNFGLFHDVRGEKHGFACSTEFDDGLPEKIGAYRIQPREGLVKKQYRRLMGNGGDKLHLLRHPLGQLRDGLCLPVGEIKAVEPIIDIFLE